MKRFPALLTAAALLLLAGCAPSGGREDPSLDGDDEETVLTLWSYPIGGWGKTSTVSSLLTAFHRDNPNIRVVMDVVDYDTGDSEVEEAIRNNAAPDLIFEGPERLVAGWGERRKLVPLNDLWQEGFSGDIYASVAAASHDAGGNYYIYPMCMTTHCMAINRELFEQADAWQYVNAETHTWTTEGFVKAVQALHAYGVEEVAAVYCKDQGGDQGTRALVNNLYGGTFTNAEHTRYTVDSAQNIAALELLQGTDGIVFDDTLVGGDEIEKFCRGELAMAFCWNVAIDITQTINGNLNFYAFPMAFPTDQEEPALQGGIWGFGIFDNGDETKIEAAKTFIRYLLQEDVYERAVTISTYWPVWDIPGMYENDKQMLKYGIFSRYLGDYYQVMTNWGDARKAWWQMLQKIGKGTQVTEAVAEFTAAVNGNS